MNNELKKIEAEINTACHGEYNTKNLNEKDTEFMRGFIYCIDCVLTTLANITCPNENRSILEKLKNEIIEVVSEDVYKNLILDGADIVYSCEDSYEVEE